MSGTKPEVVAETTTIAQLTQAALRLELGPMVMLLGQPRHCGFGLGGSLELGQRIKRSKPKDWFTKALVTCTGFEHDGLLDRRGRLLI